ncbi:hypothetical protein FXO37_25890 [Capsicum annuum]|nr:hypothetical protein FXO37_25890 [Capsicum annuum]
MVLSLIVTGELARRVYDSLRKEAACLRIQTDVHMHLAGKDYKELCSAAISIQTGMCGMAARNEGRFRRQTKAEIIFLFKETKEMLVKERETAKWTAEKIPMVKEVPVVDHEMMNKLSLENDKPKGRFQERNFDLESENQILQQALSTPAKQIDREGCSEPSWFGMLVTARAPARVVTPASKGFRSSSSDVNLAGGAVHQMPPILVQKIFSQAFSYISVQLFNRLYIRSTDITNDLCPVISCMRVLLTEDSNNTKSNSFLLDDNSRPQVLLVMRIPTVAAISYVIAYTRGYPYFKISTAQIFPTKIVPLFPGVKPMNLVSPLSDLPILFKSPQSYPQ